MVGEIPIRNVHQVLDDTDAANRGSAVPPTLSPLHVVVFVKGHLYSLLESDRAADVFIIASAPVDMLWAVCSEVLQ